MEVNMRLYIFLSHLGLAFILMYSFMKYNEFYSAVVYLSTEKFPRTIIYNFFLMIFIILCKLLLNIFIGELRYLEVEQLIDNARAFIMDTILFLVLSKPTINGKEVSSIILIKYLSIIVILKAYHLVLYSRVSHIFELGVPRTRVLVKLFLFMCLLSVANLTMFTYFYKYSLKNSTMYLWLFFESLSIFESCQISIFKFFVNIIDLRSANGLSSKATILFFLDILHDIMSLIIFLVFILVFILNNFSNLPLHMTADIIHVVKTLISRFKSFQRYRELTKNIETKFADATEEELKEVECLKSWFIQQQTCPICRTEIKPQNSKENAQNDAKQKEEEQQQQEEEEKKEQKINQLTIQEIITKASFLPSDKNSPYLNDPATASMFPPKEDDCVMFSENVEVKQRIKILADLCDYYRELCLTCLKEIDKINYTAVPANVMLRNIYGSLNYNVLNNAEEDEVKKYLTKISHVPQMSVFKSYLERVLIEDMKYTKEICSLM